MHPGVLPLLAGLDGVQLVLGRGPGGLQVDKRGRGHLGGGRAAGLARVYRLLGICGHIIMLQLGNYAAYSDCHNRSLSAEFGLVIYMKI